MKLLLTLCVLISALLLLPAARAQETGKTLRVGQSDVYVFDRMTTAAVGSPSIADIVPLSSRRLLVNAKRLGQTTLFVCDHAGTHRLQISVVPVPLDLETLLDEMTNYKDNLSEEWQETDRGCEFQELLDAVEAASEAVEELEML